MSNPCQEYYLKNREHIIQKELARYHANIEEMDEKRKKTITCDCGVVVRKNGFASHKKTKQHLKFMETH